MKIQPVTRNRLPGYPSLEAARACPTLLDAVPKRWTASPGLAVALGLGLLARPVELQAEEGPAKPASAAALPVTGDPAGKPAAADRSAASLAAWVVPVLAEALAQDGRGSFGCVAVSPPVILSEAEAVEIIQAELKAAGLNPELNVKVDGVYQPVDDSAASRSSRMSKRGPAVSSRLGLDESAPAELGRKEAVFDVGDRGRSIFVEYLSLKDHQRWTRSERMSSVSSYNFPDLVPVVADAFSRKTGEKPEIYGIFFDPLAQRPWRGGRGSIAGLTPAQQRLAGEELAREDAGKTAALPEQSREKLREQVRYFVKQLREKGVLPPA
jgi:hypothetical protein